MAKTKKRRQKKKSKLLLELLLILILFIIVFIVNVQNRGGGIKGIVATFLGQSRQTLEELETKYVLILGVSKDINVNLTDTIMVAGYNPKTQNAMIMSISRDTFVGKNKSKARALDKLNSIYPQKGIEGIKTRVNELTGLNIEDYVIIKNEAVIDIVDAIGPIKYDVPIDMKYDDPTQDLHIDLKRGLQDIDGQKAEWLLRFRHNNDGTTYPANYGDNDMGRMRTQREFIKEVLKQMLNVKNIFNIKEITNVVYDNVETSLEKQEIFAYISCLAEFDINNFKTYVFPGAPEKCNGLWFFVHDKEKTKELINQIEKEL